MPSLPQEEIEAAIAAAKAERAEWATRPAKQRAALLRKWHDLIIESADEPDQILTAELGKPLAEAKGEILSNAAYLEWFSYYIGARELLDGLPKVDWLLVDRGYDADWFRAAMKDKGVRACIPARKQHKTIVKYDKRRYERRKRIEMMSGRLKDWRRVATRYEGAQRSFSPQSLRRNRHLLVMNPDPSVSLVC